MGRVVGGERVARCQAALLRLSTAIAAAPHEDICHSQSPADLVEEIRGLVAAATARESAS
jgi:hypothetical protein